MKNKQTQVLITDSTLRDGNHAAAHQLDAESVARYCRLADAAGVSVVEVGHGNGVGASSLQVGLSLLDDRTMLETARANLRNSRLGIHVIPGFATIERDLKPAIAAGVDVIRVASHCTEADTTQRHIGFCRDEAKTVFGVLMMSHMAEISQLCEEAKKMEAYGAEAVVIMDSSGTYMPADVTLRIEQLRDSLSIPVGFHAHNNLGMAIANSVAAIEAGATLIDGCIKGFGAGAGNAPIEVLVAVLQRLNISTNIDLYKILDAADDAEQTFVKQTPTIKSLSVASGLYGVFSGFAKHVSRLSKEYNVDVKEVFRVLGERRAVAGQEDLILEVVKNLSESRSRK